MNFNTINDQLLITPVYFKDISTVLLEHGLDIDLINCIITQVQIKCKPQLNITLYDIWWICGPVVTHTKCNCMIFLYIPDLSNIDVLKENTKILITNKIIYYIRIHAQPQTNHVTVFNLLTHSFDAKHSYKKIYNIITRICHPLRKLNQHIYLVHPIDTSDMIEFIPKRPMQLTNRAQLVALCNETEHWIFQKKYDGQRIILVCEANETDGILQKRNYRLYSRAARLTILQRDSRIIDLINKIPDQDLPAVLEGEAMPKHNETFEEGLGQLRRYGTHGHEIFFFNWWSPNNPQATYEDRFCYLKTLLLKVGHQELQLVQVLKNKQNTLIKIIDDVLKEQNCEGIIIRSCKEQQLVSISKHFYKFKKTMIVRIHIRSLKLGLKAHVVLANIQSIDETAQGTASIIGQKTHCQIIARYVHQLNAYLEERAAKGEIPPILTIKHLGFTGRGTFRFSPSISVIQLLESILSDLYKWPELLNLYQTLHI